MSHRKAQFYSVVTFTGKNHFKLLHNDMQGVSVSVRIYSTFIFNNSDSGKLLTCTMQCLTNDLSTMKTKLTNKLLTDGSYCQWKDRNSVFQPVPLRLN